MESNEYQLAHKAGSHEKITKNCYLEKEAVIRKEIQMPRKVGKTRCYSV